MFPVKLHLILTIDITKYVKFITLFGWATFPLPILFFTWIYEFGQSAICLSQVTNNKTCQLMMLNKRSPNKLCGNMEDSNLILPTTCAWWKCSSAKRSLTFASMSNNSSLVAPSTNPSWLSCTSYSSSPDIFYERARASMALSESTAYILYSKLEGWRMGIGD